MSSTQVCPACGERKPLAAFRYGGRLRSRCADCVRAAAKASYRRHRKERIEAAKRRQAELKATDPERVKGWHRAYRERHRDELAEKDRAYYAEHKQKILQRKAQYYHENRERIRERQREYERSRRQDSKPKPEPSVKTCVRCGDTKPADQFPLRESSRPTDRSVIDYAKPSALVASARAPSPRETGEARASLRPRRAWRYQ